MKVSIKCRVTKRAPNSALKRWEKPLEKAGHLSWPWKDESKHAKQTHMRAEGWKWGESSLSWEFCWSSVTKGESMRRGQRLGRLAGGQERLSMSIKRFLATKHLCRNYWACAPEPGSCSSWACASQQEKPPQWEACVPVPRKGRNVSNSLMQVSNDSDQLSDDGTSNNSLNDRMYICVSVYTWRVSDL